MEQGHFAVIVGIIAVVLGIIILLTQSFADVHFYEVSHT